MRLIDADALYEELSISDMDIYCKEVIMLAPTVEAKHVVHGEWIKEIGDIHSSGEFVYCSNCGNATFIPSKRILSTTNFRHFEKPNFCPNCGSDMRGKKE